MDTWLIVQQRLSKRQAPTRTGEIHFFSQKVYCNECQKVFARNVYKVKDEPNGRRVYLQCKGAKKYRTCGNNKSVRLDMLEEAVTNEINLQLKKFYNESLLEQQYNNEMNVKSKYTDRVRALDLEKAKIERKINDQNIYYKGLYEDKINKVISDDEFMMLRESYVKDLEVLKKRATVIDEELKLLQAKATQNDNSKGILKKYRKIDKLNRVIIDELINKIYIGSVKDDTKERDIIMEWGIEAVA